MSDLTLLRGGLLLDESQALGEESLEAVRLLTNLETERSKLLPEILGKQIFNNYLKLKMADWEEHRTHVTPREHDKYLGI